MRKKIVISIAIVALLLVGIMTTSVLASNTKLAKNTTVSKELLAVAKAETSEKLVREASPTLAVTDEVEQLSTREVSPDAVSTVDVETLRETVPRTYEETDTQVSTQRVRFLLYTHDGKHVMWGFVGNGYLVGQDNMGKRCWGIYGKGVFAGFYDGEFFWGRYRGGNWKAEGLFGANYTHGKYILFPTADITPAITATDP